MLINTNTININTNINFNSNSINNSNGRQAVLEIILPARKATSINPVKHCVQIAIMFLKFNLQNYTLKL
jgi:hypothetical protein